MDTRYSDTTFAGSRAAFVVAPLVISVGYFQFNFPQIIAFLPVNEDNRLNLSEIGAITA